MKTIRIIQSIVLKCNPELVLKLRYLGVESSDPTTKKPAEAGFFVTAYSCYTTESHRLVGDDVLPLGRTGGVYGFA